MKMTNCIPQAICFFAIFYMDGIDAHSCEKHVCFTWSISEEVLNLKCRVDNLSFRVKIKDPSNKIIGECYPGHQKSNCKKYSNNVFIIQNITTNETTCSIHGTIDNRMNGNWKCVHGTNKGLADVDVTVLRYKDKTCRAMLLAIIGYSGAIAIWFTILSICQIKVNVLEGVNKLLNMQCMPTRIKMGVNKLLNMQCMTTRKKMACKWVTFIVLTTLILIILWIYSDTTDKDCTRQYSHLAIAFVCGLTMAILFLNKEKGNTAPAQSPMNNPQNPVSREEIAEPAQLQLNHPENPVSGEGNTAPAQSPMNNPQNPVSREEEQNHEQAPKNISVDPDTAESAGFNEATSKGPYRRVPTDDKAADGDTSPCNAFAEESL